MAFEEPFWDKKAQLFLPFSPQFRPRRWQVKLTPHRRIRWLRPAFSSWPDKGKCSSKEWQLYGGELSNHCGFLFLSNLWKGCHTLFESNKARQQVIDIPTLSIPFVASEPNSTNSSAAHPGNLRGSSQEFQIFIADDWTFGL
jgi:hypothetical protein